MATVTLDGISKTYPAPDLAPRAAALHDLNLHVESGEFMVLVGPSGCGKSTVLRIIAGLEEATTGEVRIDGKGVDHLLPKERDVAMVFQNYALYPHLSVAENIGFSLRMRKMPRAEIETRVGDVAALLGLGGLLDRRPKSLSGGERQRVALGRAIVRQPKVFLLDEPLSNLDANLRVAMRAELCKLHATLGITMIYVTHDQVEAMTMGTRIAVMRAGQMIQCAAPAEVYDRPKHTFVASFMGTPPMNLVRGAIVHDRNGRWFVERNAEPKRLRVALPPGVATQAAESADVMLGIRPEHLHEAKPGEGFAAVVELAERMGAETYLHAATGAHRLVARVGPDARYRVGDAVRIIADPARLHVFAAATGAALD